LLIHVLLLLEKSFTYLTQIPQSTTISPNTSDLAMDYATMLTEHRIS
jgi:hypothetical protein